MKQDVLDALSGRIPNKIPSKETLNHPGIINHVSGLDVFENTPEAYRIAFKKLGIDIHVPLPEGNAPRPRVPGGTWEENGSTWADVGVYPTSMPIEHCPGIEKDPDGEWVFSYDTSRDDFELHSNGGDGANAHLNAAIRSDRLGRADVLRATHAKFRADFGDEAAMYLLYYTTLFMWPVKTFDWSPFMIAAMTDPRRFDENLWEPWSKISRKQIEAMAEMDEDVLFCHDDLAMTTGPVFPVAFYEKHIFSRYDYIFEPAVKAGKKIVFVCDGNMDAFLERLLEFPIAGIMPENPATPYARILDTWGRAGRGFICGIETAKLTNGTPEQIRDHTKKVIEISRAYPGFMISSPGGLYGNIPLENLLAYFRARNEMGIPAEV